MTSKRESVHAARPFDSELDELESVEARLRLEEQEAVTSSHVVRMIDFFFAFVLSQGVYRFKETIAAPWSCTPQALLALFVILYVVVRSFLGWHMAIEERRYRLYVRRVRTTELWRVYLDVAIVLVYAYMLNNAVGLQDDGRHDLTAFVWAFPVLFVLYGGWGHLRRVAWGEDQFDLIVLMAFCGLYSALAAAYTLEPIELPFDRAESNFLTLCVALALMIAYRRINFWQGLGPHKSRFAALTALRFPSLKTLQIEDGTPRGEGPAGDTP